MEDYIQGGSQVPFANFGTVTFKDAVATSTFGQKSGPQGAQLIELALNGKQVTSVSTTSSEVLVKYLG